MECEKNDTKLNLGIGMIKKVLQYPEVLRDHPSEEFIKIYQEKKHILGSDN